MDTLAWPVIAVAVTALFVLATALLVRSLVKGRVPVTSPEEAAELLSLPMTPLQKRAWWGLAVSVLMAAACALVIATAGPLAYFEDGDLRLVVLAFLMTALAAHVVVLAPTGLRGGGAALDERDQQVLARAPQLQTAASLVTVAAWMLALTETYRGEGIPTGFMFLVFWSVLVAQVIAHSAGILLGYWLARQHGEG